MIAFNELRLTSDKDKLIVDCYVQNSTALRNVHIESAYVEYYKNYRDGQISDKAICLFEATDNNTVSLRESLDVSTISIETFGTDTFDGGLFYVIVRCDGTVPDEYDVDPGDFVAVGVVADLQALYERGMGYIAKMSYHPCDKCEIPIDFEQFILRWFALRVAVVTCDIPVVSKLWEGFARGIKDGTGISCGC